MRHDNKETNIWWIHVAKQNIKMRITYFCFELHLFLCDEYYVCFAWDWFIPKLKILKKKRHCVHSETIHAPDSSNEDGDDEK